MEATIFIHIGLPKTGSTAIQQLLLHNREQLSELGYYRPVAGSETFRHSHDDLARAIDGRELNRGPRLIENLAAELREAGEPRNIVISTEGLSRNIADRSVRDRLADVSLSLGYRPHVLAYVRPQPGAINSAFTQRVKTWHAPERFGRFFKSQLASPLFDYHARLAPLLADNRFAATIRPYNQAVLDAGLCADFLMVLGLSRSEASAFSVPRFYNVSPGPKTIAAMQQMAHRLEAASESIPLPLLTAMSRPVISIADGYGWNASRFDGVNGKRLKKAQARFGESNDAFAQAAWRSPWNEIFPEERERVATPNIFHLGEASEAERTEFFEFVEEATAALRELSTTADPAAIIAMAEES